MTTCVSLLKIFENEEWAEQFLRGKLYCNPLRYFRTLEQGGDGRGDPFEGASSLMQPSEVKKVTITARGRDLPPLVFNSEDLRSPIVVHRDANLSQRVFCMYAIHFQDDELRFDKTSDEDSAKRVEAVKQRFKIDERCYGLGSHAVYIHDRHKFLEALGACADKNGIKIRHGLVKYYDEKTTSRAFPQGFEVFHKSAKFYYQCEYRLAFEFDGDKACELEIGDMSEFAVKLPVNSLRNIECEVELYK